MTFFAASSDAGPPIAILHPPRQCPSSSTIISALALGNLSQHRLSPGAAYSSLTPIQRARVSSAHIKTTPASPHSSLTSPYEVSLLVRLSSGFLIGIPAIRAQSREPVNSLLRVAKRSGLFSKNIQGHAHPLVLSSRQPTQKPAWRRPTSIGRHEAVAHLVSAPGDTPPTSQESGGRVKMAYSGAAEWPCLVSARMCAKEVAWAPAVLSLVLSIPSAPPASILETTSGKQKTSQLRGPTDPSLPPLLFPAVLHPYPTPPLYPRKTHAALLALLSKAQAVRNA
ncbi:hypothetical protein EJ06DRAFT_155731 [Trichodelitschia bisporula]|uniref:Uncharacterized protein n=1 Tax=Trichodelitschia bisporula TaxID=703511 RepID=A0A6G1HNG6_9PEZI|nr:hypothetical protein EJ06DRAFT_155731 [Trichodelitschia bisporula]